MAVADTRGALWLAARLTFRRGGGNAALMSVLALGMVLLTMLTLATLAAPHASSMQRQRAQAISPRVDSAESAKVTSKTLATFDPRLPPVRPRWNGHSILRTYYARGSSSLVAPGVARMPGVGQFYASPQLQRLMRSDPTVAALFRGYDLVGTIADVGLTHPHEFRAIIGVSSDEALLLPVKGFGVDRSQAPEADNARLNTVVAVLVMFALWIPGIAFIVIVTRLAARQRQRRARSIRLLGVSRLVTRLIQASETMLVTFPMALLGCVAYTTLVRATTKLPGTAFGYLTADVEQGLGRCAVVVIALTITAGASTASSLRLDRQDVSAVPTRPPGRLASFGLVVLIAGIGYLIAIPIVVGVVGNEALLGAAGPTVAYGMWTACGAVASGLALAGPRIVAEVFTRAAQRVGAGGTLVGFRLHSSGSATTLKLGSILGVIIIVMLGTLSFMSVLNGGSAATWNKALVAHRHVPVVVNDFGGSLSLQGVTDIYPDGGAIQARELGGRVPAVVYGDCADLHRLTGTAPQRCTGQPQWITFPGHESSARLPTGGSVKVPGVGAVALPPRTATTVVRNFPEKFDGALLMPAQSATTRATRNGSYFFLVVEKARLTETLAGISSKSPTIEFDLGQFDRRNPDLRPFPTQLQWLTIGLCASLAIGALALAAATIAEARDRSQRMRGLRLLGTPWSHLIRAHFWSAGAPLLLLGWSATSIGWIVCQCLHAFDDRAVVSLEAIAGTATAVLVVGILVTAVTLPDVLKPSYQLGTREA